MIVFSILYAKYNEYLQMIFMLLTMCSLDSNLNVLQLEHKKTLKHKHIFDFKIIKNKNETLNLNIESEFSTFSCI